MRAIRLKTEHLFEPVGVDFSAPRLYWNCDSGIKQSAYQIIASDDEDNILWDSGKVESNSMSAKWEGKPISPKKRYYGRCGYGMKKTMLEIGQDHSLRRESISGRLTGSPAIIK